MTITVNFALSDLVKKWGMLQVTKTGRFCKWESADSWIKGARMDCRAVVDKKEGKNRVKL